MKKYIIAAVGLLALATIVWAASWTSYPDQSTIDAADTFIFYDVDDATAAKINEITWAQFLTELIAEGLASTAGDVYTGAHDFGGATVEIPNSNSGDAALTVEGQIHYKSDEDFIALHGGTAGEAQGEHGFSALQHIVLIVDLSWYYDQETTYRALPIMTVGDDFPHGFTITELSLRAVGGDPTTELTVTDLYCDTTPDYNLAADATKMDDLDTTAGVFSEDTTFVSATCANGSYMYIDIGADPTDANVIWIFEMWGYAEED